jgi:predicted DNA-binding transcriptional regulator AlpA
MTKKKVVLVQPQAEIPPVQPPPDLPDELLKVEEVMKIFGISRSEVTSLMHRGMPHFKLGKRQRNLRFDRQKLATWLQEQEIIL